MVDAQLPPALAEKIKELGYNAKHLQEMELLEANDSTVWNYALDEHTILITKDENFAIRASVSNKVAAIVWIRTANFSDAALLDWFDQEWSSVIATLDAGNRMVEITS